MIDSIKQFILSFWSEILNVLNILYDSIMGVLIFVVNIGIEGLLTVVSVFIGALDVGNLATAAAGAWGIVSPNVVYLITQSGIPTGLTFIGYAWGIRFLLNLIPAAFTRI